MYLYTADMDKVMAIRLNNRDTHLRTHPGLLQCT